ncbi:MAG: ParB/RepB/Spo0J family partition protein [Myxococcota bacterium]
MNLKKGLNTPSALGGGNAKGRKALGRGLGALIPNVSSKRDYFECEIERIKPDIEQPRRHMDPEGIAELSESIKASGLIQPLIVRQDGADYRLIAGERRWRAANKAGLKTVPVVIKDVDRDEAFELALVENIQREDLNPLEEAQAYQRLMDMRSYTQDALAKRLGRSRPSVANTLRLLKLPGPVRNAVSAGDLSEGAARAVLSLPSEGQQIALCTRAIEDSLSVRSIEAIARKVKQGLTLDEATAAVLEPAPKPSAPQPSPEQPPPTVAEASPAPKLPAEAHVVVEEVVEQPPTAPPEEEDAQTSSESAEEDASHVGEEELPSAKRFQVQTPGDVKVLVAQLEQAIHTRVTLQDRGDRGVLQIHFNAYAQLRELLKHLSATSGHD